jgi:hypothetical protein
MGLVYLLLCFIDTLWAFNNPLEMIKIDRKMTELRHILCDKYIMLALVDMLVYCVNSLLIYGYG